MKKIIVLASLVFLCATANVEAGNSSSGTLAGAAGGAVVGQAIGHNTESTLVGAAIGGVVGYIVGSGMDGGYARPAYGGGYVMAPSPVPVYREVYMPPPPPVNVVIPYYRPYYRPVDVVVISEPGHHHRSPRWSGRHNGHRDHRRHWR